MGRPTVQAQKVGKHDRDIARIEDLRHNLPVNIYIEVLHVAATTGKLREYDNQGTLLGVKDISSNQQLDTAKYLVDKAMPNKAPARIEAAPSLSLEQAVEAPEELTTDQLKHLAYGTDEPIITDVEHADPS